MPLPDYYRILGVNRTAKPHEIRAAYRRLARRYHPDLHPGNPRAEEAFKSINQAYAVLGNAVQRRQYDVQTSPPIPTIYTTPTRPTPPPIGRAAAPRRTTSQRRPAHRSQARLKVFIKAGFLLIISGLFALLAYVALLRPTTRQLPPATIISLPGQIELALDTPQHAVFFADSQGMLHTQVADVPKKFLSMSDKVVLPYEVQLAQGRNFLGVTGEAVAAGKAVPIAVGEWIDRTLSGTLEILIPQVGEYVIFLKVENFAGTLVANPRLE